MDRGDYTEPVIEPCRLGAKDAAARIERGELNARELVESCLARIAAREPEVQAWAFANQDAVLSQLNDIEKAAPLRGVPVGVKDIFDTCDMPTEYGSRIYAGHRPRADSAPVALTRAAGGVILGKTATCEFATFVPSRTRNPHNAAHTPGGSSSGSAAAVADFMVPLAFGTQTAGSVIRPGSYCGVVACKPTYNLLPRAGVHPNADSLDTVGIYARSVEDAAFFLEALTRRDDLHGTISRPRIGACRSFEWELVEPPMAAAFETAAKKLDAAEFRLPESFRSLREAQGTVIRYEGARSLADEYRRFADRLDPALRQRCEEGYATDGRKYQEALIYAARCRAAVNEAFGDCDVLIAPAATGEAPRGLGSTGNVAMNVVWTLLHVPCVSVPVDTGPNGLPLGIQVVGRIGDDARTLACARWIEARMKESRA
jgi:Asp-tRNA(Asn)/Glu-tRNA(Gln) amidotransferase A subunit family amidase